MKKIFILISVLLFACNSNNAKEEHKQKPTQELLKKSPIITEEFEEYPKAKDIELSFLDEYVFPEKQFLKDSEIGGLSEIDYDKGSYYMICDDYKNPRFYKAQIDIKGNKIKDVKFTDVVFLDKTKHNFYNNFLDLEAIMVQDGKLIISSEGSVRRKKNPCIFQIDSKGNFITEYPLTDNFNISKQDFPKPRHNGVFEALSKSYDNQGFWVVNELPLTTDGTKPKFPKTKSPVRFTYYDKQTKQATKEFVYELSALPRKEKGAFNINGLTAILEYKKNHFLVIERAYQNGYSGDENIAKVYKAVIKNQTTNSLKLKDLKTLYTPMKKEFVFDFNTIKAKLTNQIIDNIEGITFGEKLPNGNNSIIIISDDNFQKYGKQINQFVLFEFIEK